MEESNQLTQKWARLADSQRALLNEAWAENICLRAASNQLTREALAVCEKWERLAASQRALLNEAWAENICLRAALDSPRELQIYIAAGCTEAQAKELVRSPGRSMA
jgi:hypothetical protein